MIRDIFAHKMFPAISGCCFFLLMLFMPSIFSIIGLEGNGFYQLGVLNDIGLYTILALSLNVILGQTGLFNMGHAVFYGIGAYTTAILNTLYGIPVLLTIPIAGALAAFFALLVALPIIRLRGDYLLVVTIGIVEIFRIALTNDIFGLTGGANGIYGIARPEIFGFRIVNPVHFFYLIWFCVALSVVFFYLLEHSRIGRAFNYIKHDELAASGCGINVAFYKLQAFVLGAFWAGMAGTLYATNKKFISPDTFSFSESVLLFAIVILGGAGSIPGVILGAFIVIGLPELFRDFADARMLVFGGAMVAMMIFRPQGFLAVRRRKYFARGNVGKFACAVGTQCPSANPVYSEHLGKPVSNTAQKTEGSKP